MATPGQYIAAKLVTVINAAAIVAPNYVPGVSLPQSPGTGAVVKMPRFALEELAELKTCIASRSRAMSGAGRSPRKHDVTCQVMLLKKIDKEHTQLDGLLELVYAIDMLIGAQAKDLGWTSSSNDPEYDTDTLETQCAFKSVLTINFTAIT